MKIALRGELPTWAHAATHDEHPALNDLQPPKVLQPSLRERVEKVVSRRSSIDGKRRSSITRDSKAYRLILDCAPADRQLLDTPIGGRANQFLNLAQSGVVGVTFDSAKARPTHQQPPIHCDGS